MTPEDMMAVERRIIEEAFNRGNVGMLSEVLAPDYVLHNNGQEDLQGIEGMKEFISMSRTAFPDLHITMEDLRVADDVVISRWRARMTHQGEFVGIPPTQKQASLTGVTMTRCADGKAVETWHLSDRLGLLQQLGIV